MAFIGTQPRVKELRKPLLWEVWINPEEQCTRWTDAKPLAAFNCEVSSVENSSQHPPPSRISAWGQRILARIPREITYLFSRPSPPPLILSPEHADSKLSLPLHGSDVQVSLLIAMPRPFDSRGEVSRKDGLQEVVIGTTDVLFQDSDFDKHANL
ncbi:hypothetical protein BV22DRAFT_1036764 [Leucogyrophana mollusca]|uniref:Uncharacterized protein n=1 Tax=Leucogyrophana mollusca TaxID=85980 RepID=A0ACB8BB98_9AGAM|nr:hypothetical protein BV22DRAFT_1036764 [Leucogyrophana mollusca]